MSTRHDYRPIGANHIIITLRRDATAKCWTATFRGCNAIMPQGVPIALPFTLDASLVDVVADVARRHPRATIVSAGADVS